VVKPDRERYVWLYCSSLEDKQRYRDLAKSSGIPLSKFLLGLIEDQLAQRDKSENGPDIAEELESLRDEMKTTRNELRLRNLVIQKYEADIMKFKAEPFLDTSFAGKRKFEPEIIQLIKKSGSISTSNLMAMLGVDAKDTDAVDALSEQLEALESYGLIELNSLGWTWLR